MRNVAAVILAGGQGERLSVLSAKRDEDRPGYYVARIVGDRGDRNRRVLRREAVVDATGAGRQATETTQNVAEGH